MQLVQGCEILCPPATMLFGRMKEEDNDWITNSRDYNINSNAQTAVVSKLLESIKLRLRMTKNYSERLKKSHLRHLA